MASSRVRIAGLTSRRGQRAYQNVGDLERWLSLIAGGAVVVKGLLRWPLSGMLLAATGGYLVYRGLTGRCTVYEELGISTVEDTPGRGIIVEQSVVVNRTPGEVYAFWRSLENLPRFMNHLKSVSQLDSKRSRWIAKAPLDASVEWDAEVTVDRESEVIAWRSLPGSQVPNEGAVYFRPAIGGAGTQVRVLLKYRPPGGAVGAAIAKAFGEEPEVQIAEDLRRFKELMEAGTTSGGQVAGDAARSRGN